MNLVLVGLNHRTAPVEVRERMAVPADGLDAVYGDLQRLGLGECLVVSTCNRVEVLAAGTDERELEERAAGWFLGRGGAAGRAEGHLYVHRGREAARHLFQVASSLDSMVLGEPQILGQLKDAYREAVTRQGTGPVLNKLMHKGFSVAKRVRTETGIASHAVSVGSAAVELARKIFGELTGHSVLLIGAGDMAELTAEHLLAQGAESITVANRSIDRAWALARRFGGRSALLDELPSLLVDTDIVISSTGAPGFVVTAAQVKSILKPRRFRPLFFVDIAVPRDVDPDVHRLGNVYLYDIDDLQTVVEENRDARAQEALRAGRIVEEETVAFFHWMEMLDTFPTIQALNEKAEAIRKAEWNRTMARLKDITPEQREALEVMTRSLTHKLVHDPILFIKNAGRRGDKERRLEMARRMLGLDGQHEEMEALDAPREGETPGLMKTGGPCSS